MSVRDDQLATLNVAGKDYDYYRIADLPGVDHLPYSLKVLVENLVRNIDGANITDEHVKALLNWAPQAQPSHEIQFTPSRVIMQDFTGVPCIVDLATMRDAVKDLGGDPEVINPQVQSDMVIDHSVQIDKYGVADAVQQNMDIEYQRNGERYQFLRWGQQAFRNFRVVPPGTGIIHQVNIEYLAKVVMTKTSGLDDGRELAYLDSCVGTDSHTTTENGLGVLGWGVGGIEAEAAMLGQPISMLVPRVVGFKLTGSIPEGVTATDVVLTITDMLRKHGVVGKFVEFYGEGIASVPLANRATIGNMGPEFGSTCGIFPIDGVTLDYLRLTGRSEEQVALVEAYAKANKLWGDASDPDYVEPQYSEYEELDLGTVVPSIAGPKRPQDRILLSEAKDMFEKTAPAYETDKTVKDPVAVSTDFRGDFDIENGDGLRLRVRRRPPLEGPRRARRRAVRMGRAFDVRAQADLLRRHEGHAGASRRHPRRPRAGVARRLGHHRPHLPGGRVQGVQPGWQVPDRARRGAEELQLLWLASRQPRDYGAWYLRQHPPAQPAARLRRRGGHAGRVHLRFHDWKAFDDL